MSFFTGDINISNCKSATATEMYMETTMSFRDWGMLGLGVHGL